MAAERMMWIGSKVNEEGVEILDHRYDTHERAIYLSTG